MKILEKMTEAGYHVDWSIVRLGWIGPGLHGRVVFKDDIADFALKRIEDATDANLPYIADLCACENEATISSNLERIVPEISNIALRIWIVFLLDEFLKSLPNDWIQGLINFSDFWSDFNNPENYPLTRQGVNNNITPEEYYTEENYLRTIENHKQWLLDESLKLKKESFGNLGK